MVLIFQGRCAYLRFAAVYDRVTLDTFWNSIKNRLSGRHLKATRKSTRWTEFKFVFYVSAIFRDDFVPGKSTVHHLLSSEEERKLKTDLCFVCILFCLMSLSFVLSHHNVSFSIKNRWRVGIWSTPKRAFRNSLNNEHRENKSSENIQYLNVKVWWYSGRPLVRFVVEHSQSAVSSSSVLFAVECLKKTIFFSLICKIVLRVIHST